jgi:hypothetical protein
MPGRRKVNSKTVRVLLRQQDARLRVFAAINQVRKGESPSLSAAARAEGTTVRTIRRMVPAALIRGQSGGRIRVRASDPYSARVEILTDSGIAVVSARGSRQRELAGQHRATWLRVSRDKEPPSALEQYRGKKVGGFKLLSDYDRLGLLARAGVLGQLDTLYVSPDVSV